MLQIPAINNNTTNNSPLDSNDDELYRELATLKLAKDNKAINCLHLSYFSFDCNANQERFIKSCIIGGLMCQKRRWFEWMVVHCIRRRRRFYRRRQRGRQRN